MEIVPKNITCSKCNQVGHYFIKQLGPHKGAFCKTCLCWIKHIPWQPDIKIHFGKFKGTFLKDFASEEELSWLKWAHDKATTLSPTVRAAIAKHLGI